MFKFYITNTISLCTESDFRLLKPFTDHMFKKFELFITILYRRQVHRSISSDLP